MPPPAEAPAPAAAGRPPADLRWTVSAGGGAPVVRRRKAVVPDAAPKAPALPSPAPPVAPRGPQPPSGEGIGTRPIEGRRLLDAIHAFWSSFEPPEPDVRKLAEPLILGVLEHLAELDRIVEASSLNWRLERMARVDRNILRLGVYELAHRLDVPTKVCLNEAIEIARRYGSEESGAFINGILDRIAQQLRGPIEQGEGEAEEGGRSPGEPEDGG